MAPRRATRAQRQGIASLNQARRRWGVDRRAHPPNDLARNLSYAPICTTGLLSRKRVRENRYGALKRRHSRPAHSATDHIDAAVCLSRQVLTEVTLPVAEHDLVDFWLRETMLYAVKAIQSSYTTGGNASYHFIQNVDLSAYGSAKSVQQVGDDGLLVLCELDGSSTFVFIAMVRDSSGMASSLSISRAWHREGLTFDWIGATPGNVIVAGRTADSDGNCVVEACGLA